MGFSHCFVFCLVFTAAVVAKDLQPTTQAQSSSHPLLSCFSRDLVTFRCRWDVGPFQNHTEAGDLKLFYKLDNSKNGDSTWKECPSYSKPVKNECYFSKEHTIIWFTYIIQLRSGNSEIYHKLNFSVEKIVFPDPPEVLNWTLLTLASTDLLCDVLVSWNVPSSAVESVKVGWMTLLYEPQYRQNGSDQWNSLGSLTDTEAHIYGLQTDTEYEVRVRSKMRGYNFGAFSDSITILVPSKGPGSRTSVAVMLILTIAAIGLILMLIMVSRQQKLMVILLPPVPGPKIKEIDADLLKESRTCIQKLQGEMRALQNQHQRERTDWAAGTQRKLGQKDAEMQAALDRKEAALEEMRKKMKGMEKEKQSEILKLQMEFSVKLARAQSMSLKTQQQPQGPGIIPQNIFKRKLQSLQEEKNKEIESLRQRVKELEHQSLCGFSESRLKRRKM